MKKLFNKFFFILTAITISFAYSACSTDNNKFDEPYENNQTVQTKPTALERKLYDTSWKLSSSNSTDGRNSSKSNIGDIISFSSLSYGNYKGVNLSLWKALYINGEKMGAWYGRESDIIIEYTPWDARMRGQYSITFGSGVYLKSLSSTQMVFQSDRWEWIYSRVDNETESGGTSNYEKPEVYYYDSTSGTTSLKVVFKIGNKDRTKVTTAKGYCGSKSVDGSIGSALITFNFSGLSKGTKYQIYCTVKGPGGSFTSDSVTLSTLN